MSELVLVQGPDTSLQVVTVDQVKKQIHVDTSADDERIQSLIEAAVERIDGPRGVLGRALLPQTWQLQLPNWGHHHESRWQHAIRLPLPPTIGVTRIEYVDSSGNLQTLAADQYRVVPGGNEGDLILEELNVQWPSVFQNLPDAVRVTFDCGYRSTTSPEDNAVPKPIQQAVVMTVESWYDKTGLEDLPEVVQTLLLPYRKGLV